MKWSLGISKPWQEALETMTGSKQMDATAIDAAVLSGVQKNDPNDRNAVARFTSSHQTRFFSEAAHLIRPGGALVICDDVLRSTSASKAERVIQRFKRGWHVNSLLTPGELRSLAAASGLGHEATGCAQMLPALDHVAASARSSGGAHCRKR